MPKPAPKSEPPPSSPRPARAPSPGFLLGYRLLKLGALVVGLPAALLCLMALVGAFTDNGWARAIGALVVAFGAPLAIADRMLPEHDPTRARGLVSDVCTVTWMLVATAFVALPGGATRPLLTREGDRLVSAGHPDMARGAYLLAGVTTEMSATPAPPEGGSASAGASASAPPVAGSASASGATSASAAPSAQKPPPKADPREKSPADIFKEYSPAVVTIFVKQKMGAEGSGTGFLVDREGTIATNHHVIDEAGHVRIKFQNGAVYEDVELLVDEPAVDLALVRVSLTAPLDGGPRPDAAPLTLGDSESIVVGERAVSIGNPLGLEHTLTDGLVSSRRIYEGRAWIQFSAPISPGNSGGPLFNMRGEVIGITTATLSGIGRGFAVPQNLNLAVPVNELKKLFRPTYAGRHKFADGAAPSHW
jgi:S1-C subfamily serine protease